MDPASLTVVMVQPRYAANVGAMARAAANFGLAGLRLVAPNEITLEGMAERVARAGDSFIQDAVIVETLDEALAGIDLSIATSHRAGRHREPVAPWVLASEVLPALAPRSVALVLGPEDHGLTWEHLERCDRLVSIPSETPLNVAQAGIVILYELCMRPVGRVSDAGPKGTGEEQGDAGATSAAQPTDSLRATASEAAAAAPGDVKRIIDVAGRALALTGYPRHTRTLREEMNRLADIVARAAPNSWETNFLMGMFKHVELWALSRDGDGLGIQDNRP